MWRLGVWVRKGSLWGSSLARRISWREVLNRRRSSLSGLSTWSVVSAPISVGLLGGFFGLVFSKTLPQFLGRFNLWFFGTRRSLLTRTTSGVASNSAMFGFSRVVLLSEALIVVLDDVLRNAFHGEDLDIDVLTVGEGILDELEGFFVNLTHVNAQTSGRVQATITHAASKMLGLLMLDEDLEIIKVAFAVIAERTGEDVLDAWVLALSFGHVECW